jgi:hypothetical protein
MLDALLSQLRTAEEEGSPGAEGRTWDPATSRVFLVCLARFEGEKSGETSFTLDDRLDNDLVALLRERGVPADRCELIQDEEATRAEVLARFLQTLARSEPDETLFFYYGSHGGYDPKTGVYEVSAFDETIEMSWFFDAIEEHFRGSRALVFADTCHSGGFVELINRRPSRLSYAALSSTFGHNTACSAWRFVECLIRGLRGDAAVDLDGDGRIDFDDLSRFTERFLSFAAEGKPMFTTTLAQSPKFVLAETTAPRTHPLVGALLEVESKGKWYPAEVLEVEGEQLQVHYTEYGHSSDEWVEPGRARPFSYERFAPGTLAEAQGSSSGKWYPVTVLAAWRTMHYVRWEGYSPAYDEWVGPSRLRARG